MFTNFTQQNVFICIFTFFFVVGPIALTSQAAQKPPPTGVVCLLKRDSLQNLSNQARLAGFWSNPAVDGVRFRTGWGMVEPQDGGYDWSNIDQILELAGAHNKFVGLSIAGGIGTPEWVYELGAERFDFTRKDEAVSMPLPWDNEFLTSFRDFVLQVGSRYDSTPALGYVVIGGVSQVIESYFVHTTEDVARFEALGGEEEWVSGAKKVIDIYAEAFPQTPFLLSMARVISDYRGWLMLEEVVKYGMQKYPGRFGVMNAGLNAYSSVSFRPNAIIRDHSWGTPVGFQMVSSTQDPDTTRLNGTLAEALEKGVNLAAHFIEVYRIDIENPEYLSDLETAGQLLKENAVPLNSGVVNPGAGSPAYRLKTRAELRHESFTVGMGPATTIKETQLKQNYPNPFNPETWIPYELSEDSHVTIKVYNLNGQMVRTLDLGLKMQGHYTSREKAAYWDGRNDFGEKTASGIYIYVMRAGDYVAQQKMIIVK